MPIHLDYPESRCPSIKSFSIICAQKFDVLHALWLLEPRMFKSKAIVCRSLIFLPPIDSVVYLIDAETSQAHHLLRLRLILGVVIQSCWDKQKIDLTNYKYSQRAVFALAI